MSILMLKTLKDFLSLKFKVRHDSLSDQYNRIFMVKLLLVSTTLIGLNWYSDRLKCIVSSNIKISHAFVAEACWIQGFYIYDDVKAEEGTVSYDGIPTNLDHDGRNSYGALCIANSHRKAEEDKGCVPLRKTIYLQYQYMAFFLGSLAIVYYVPYVIFRMANSDIISLKNATKNESNAEEIIKTFFNVKSSKTFLYKGWLRLIVNLIVKILYVGSNAMSFFLTDKVLYGKYLQFAIMWTEWTTLPNNIMYDYMGLGEGAMKPGNKLLPTFGICEVHEGSRDIRSTVTDKHKLICEYSQHVLYHYILLILWFSFVFGMFISTITFFSQLLQHLQRYWLMWQATTDKQIFSLREFEYLQYIKRKDRVLHDTILEMFEKQKHRDMHELEKIIFGRRTYGLGQEAIV